MTISKRQTVWSNHLPTVNVPIEQSLVGYPIYWLPNQAVRRKRNTEGIVVRLPLEQTRIERLNVQMRP